MLYMPSNDKVIRYTLVLVQEDGFSRLLGLLLNNLHNAFLNASEK